MSIENQHADDDMRMDAAGLMRAVWVRLPRILAVTVLALAVTFSVLMFVPKTYESSASLQVASVALGSSNAFGMPARACCRSRAAITRARTTALHSPRGASSRNA